MELSRCQQASPALGVAAARAEAHALVKVDALLRVCCRPVSTRC